MDGDEEDQRVLAWLKTHGNPATLEEIVAGTGLSEKSLRRRMGRLVTAGFASRAGGGKFTARGKRRHRHGS